MHRKLFFRNVRARDQLELFLVSAATSVLAIRFYLHVAGYPQISSGDFHIAHMLWGGFLMLAGLTVSLAFIGARTQRLTAVLGGIGFGAFIDELGKFITRDNNYFFHPTIGLIYAVFIGLYLIFNFVSRTEKLSSREYQLNALAQLEEAIIHDMDSYEKRRVAKLLSKANPHSPFTILLRKFLDDVEIVPNDPPRRITVAIKKLGKQYQKFWRLRSSNGVVRAFFIAEALLLLVGVGGSVYGNFDQVRDVVIGHTTLYSSQLLVGQLASSIIAASFVLAGVLLIRNSRYMAFEQFRRATLINLFLTQFFVFARIQFDALPGFVFNLLLLGIINYAMYQEKAAGSE
jgi:mRNA-degrading endonuclease RelE of RelBE toxin-antitoxin system